MPTLIWVLFSMILSAIVIGIVGGISKTLVVNDFGSAFIAAFVMTLIGWLAPLEGLYAAIAPFVLGSVQPHGGAETASQYAWLFLGGFMFVVNTFLLFLIAIFTPGIEVRGVVGVIVAAAFLTMVHMAAPRLA
jgi:uncharacterized membrane protein YvlD (DUF360 family)